VPYGIDPRTEGTADGIFITPLSSILYGSGCLEEV